AARRGREISAPLAVALAVTLASAASSSAACKSGATAAAAGVEVGDAAAFSLTSPAFAAGALIPKTFTCDADDVSPPLAWSGAPSTTKSWALVADDPDAPNGTFTHWILFDVPG